MIKAREKAAKLAAAEARRAARARALEEPLGAVPPEAPAPPPRLKAAGEGGSGGSDGATGGGTEEANKGEKKKKKKQHRRPSSQAGDPTGGGLTGSGGSCSAAGAGDQPPLGRPLGRRASAALSPMAAHDEVSPRDVALRLPAIDEV